MNHPYGHDHLYGHGKVSRSKDYNGFQCREYTHKKIPFKKKVVAKQVKKGSNPTVLFALQNGKAFRFLSGTRTQKSLPLFLRHPLSHKLTILRVSRKEGWVKCAVYVSVCKWNVRCLLACVSLRDGIRRKLQTKCWVIIINNRSPVPPPSLRTRRVFVVINQSRMQCFPRKSSCDYIKAITQHRLLLATPQQLGRQTHTTQHTGSQTADIVRAVKLCILPGTFL